MTTPSSPPTTPGRNDCTFDETHFVLVRVHTAKCTECDQRNKDTMRRCPGCTFQVCRPCYERRMEDSRGLQHGNAGGGSVSAKRVTRRKILGSTEAKENDEKTGTSKAAMDDVRDGSPVPNKRRRMNATGSESKAPASASTRERPASPITAAAARLGVRRSELDVHQLLDAHGVKYKEHLLNRRQPVLSNPVIRVPSAIKNNVRKQDEDEHEDGRIPQTTEDFSAREIKEDLVFNPNGDSPQEAAENPHVQTAMQGTLFTAINAARQDGASKVDPGTNVADRLEALNRSYRAELDALMKEAASSQNASGSSHVAEDSAR